MLFFDPRLSKSGLVLGLSAQILKEQAGDPIANPGEMASTYKAAVEVLQSIPQYRTYFAEAFGLDQVDIDGG